MSKHHPPQFYRRRALRVGLAGFAASLRTRLPAGVLVAPTAAVAAVTPAADAKSWTVRTVSADEPLRQLHATGPSGRSEQPGQAVLLGTGASGKLWALSLTGAAARRVAEGIDPTTPVASGHGRIAARTAGGGLWVWDEADGGGRARTSQAAKLSAHAGLLILPLAVVGIGAAAAGGTQERQTLAHSVVRFEPDATGNWREIARSQDAVVPDARPIQVDLDGRGDGGHLVVLAGPDSTRYKHGVLGDAIEATRVLWLERHGLEVLRELSLSPPYVFEDIAPRPVMLTNTPTTRSLLTVRSGPEGGQLALVMADPTQPRGLRMAALGDGVGGLHRWLAPTTDGRQLAAVHTPHIGGVLHVYQPEGLTRPDQKLTRRRLIDDVSTHHIGSRETDLSVWLQGFLILPSQDGRRLRVLNPAADWVEQTSVPLPGRVVMTSALTDGSALAVLLEDGRVVLVGPSTRAATRG